MIIYIITINKIKINRLVIDQLLNSISTLASFAILMILAILTTFYAAVSKSSLTNRLNPLSYINS